VVASATRSPPADQHHHHLGAATLGEILGMAGEGDAASLITLFCTGA